MNLQSIYRKPSASVRARRAFAEGVMSFASRNVWLPFCTVAVVGFALLLVGGVQEACGRVDILRDHGTVALNEYFAVLEAANLSLLKLIGGALIGQSAMIGGVLQGWGLAILLVCSLCVVAYLFGASMLAYRAQEV